MSIQTTSIYSTEKITPQNKRQKLLVNYNQSVFKRTIVAKSDQLTQTAKIPKK